MAIYRNKINKRQLEIRLQGLMLPENYDINLEQYPTDASSASSIIISAYLNGDILNKRVADLGCGYGVFAIGASLMGALESKGFDIDQEMIELSVKNNEIAGASARFFNMDVSKIDETFDTVIMNPPFGSVIRGSDMKFLEKALEISKNIYSIHNARAYDFIRKFYTENAEIMDESFMSIEIPRIYKHHRHDRYKIDSVIFYVKN
ncbi:METTL5 family protein [Picrophilus oshimae]|uniref:Methyltransferase-like protein 5 n=1 Tax=Picrophilus torridus (strain ATCC 700027 / DSM 9790 / JCM 10055 / NBRC 100828 / KAW 2/3) TaxID=1122961 RepID=Q6L149_PICTO|nr:METTL5 family protein [Picrophilus oshimae]AAT43303.1 ribosomal protein L11 methyltransferase [Picrophilus oshimae DSM 9789]